MQTTQQLLDKAKKAQGIESDYRLSKVLGVVTSAVTNYRTGRSHPDDAVAARLAELAGQNPSTVIAELHAERAKTPEVKKLWLRMADQLRHAVAACMLAVGFAMLLLAPSPDGAMAKSQMQQNVNGGLYIMLNRARRIRRSIWLAVTRLFLLLKGRRPADDGVNNDERRHVSRPALTAILRAAS